MIHSHIHFRNFTEETSCWLKIPLSGNPTSGKLSVKYHKLRLIQLIAAHSNRVNLSRTILIIMSFMLVLISRNTNAQEIDFGGQVSGWVVTNPDKATHIGLRYIPDLMVGTYFGDSMIDTEISFNMYGSVQFQHNQDSILTYSDFSPYRIWLRYSASQYEVRAGLQKINFGSAMLLRALMWFDSIDPRDPLQLTDGVYGVLGRYYFLNNANIWLWVLHGNDRNRGWEIFISDKDKPEFGGRVQIPLYTGEIALTYHHRNIDVTKSPMGQILIGRSSIPENRIGLDGKWDLEVGVWFEGVFIHRDLAYAALNYQRQTNIGMDYTFNLGNGLNAITEYFTLHLSDQAFGPGEGVSMTALSLNYPVGLLDDLTVMFYYEWDNKGWYRFLSWQRTYDNWSFYLMGFWNPDQYQLYQSSIENNLYAGKGIQLLIVFNH